MKLRFRRYLICPSFAATMPTSLEKPRAEMDLRPKVAELEALVSELRGQNEVSSSLARSCYNLDSIEPFSMNLSVL